MSFNLNIIYNLVEKKNVKINGPLIIVNVEDTLLTIHNNNIYCDNDVLTMECERLILENGFEVGFRWIVEEIKTNNVQGLN